VPARRSRMRIVTLAVLAGFVLGCNAAAPTRSMAATEGSAGSELASKTEVRQLSTELTETQTLEKYVLAPIAILVAILAAGGVLGVVYSVRDQRRVSQLHELTVTGEASSQRRAEQSYGSFLEQSQTTLALVNDTLKLAKESTDQAAHSMDIKAQARVDAIEESARALMLEVFGRGEFEAIVDDHARRTRLHKIADELRSLEGYLSLQDIKLPQYTTFVKAIDQFLVDDTDSALQALRLAVQERAVGDLQRFTEYWLGYVLTTVGEYDEALSLLRRDEREFRHEDAQYFQLERIIAETEFFVIAKSRAQSDAETPSVHDNRGPFERHQLVKSLLDDLTDLAASAANSEDKRAKQHTALEIARTRADIFEWIAYHPKHLDESLDLVALKGLGEALMTHELSGADRMSPELAHRLPDGDAFRAWALSEARAICLEHEARDFDVDFALAECQFKLSVPEADNAFEAAEVRAHHELDEFREKRQKASLQECLLICHSRLLKLRERDPQLHKAEARQVRQAQTDARDTLNEIRHPRVTVFSQIQRRNISQDDFREEILAIVEQDHITPGDT
jgi:hypothetical protein